ncbi:molybdopterin-guanine dinucleotide biosynthesis protein MobA [Mucilaginibacter pallidiroseus]|uniref:Probable molybdenum cofactor guanylyltransferase n=2 Tax=Mucilaginibacter pallidiroseus TaxID=2599295 RepID=A0A563UK44_9SPHI|nr:molybdopterin-guanine dinucleotide biosynthesis protein MobA [Mucilaginibacter pallidiroseus]
MGSTCNVIKSLAEGLTESLSAKFMVAYADTTHDDDAKLPGRLAAGACLEFTDQINFSQLIYKQPITPFMQRQLFSDADIVFVNGNHQQAKAQVVIIDDNKVESLRKRVGQLTKVELFILTDNGTEVFDFLKEVVPSWQEVPVLKITDLPALITFFAGKLQTNKPKLKGLILAGGKSERMGQDKGRIDWHDKPQRYYAADLLKNYCDEVYISCRDEEQKETIQFEYSTITDTFTGLGPYGGILSAFRHDPDAAWLVLACDLPLVDNDVLQSLTANRNTARIATAFKNAENDFPEPLITIYEPKAYPVLLQFLARGYTCPRKVLINTDVELLPSPANNVLANVNTPEEMEQIQSIIRNSNVLQNAK